MMITNTLATLFTDLPALFAQAPAGAPAAPSAPSGGFGGLLLPLGLFGLMYVFLIRPQQKRQKELNALIASVKKGDRVLTNGGIYGYVAEVKERTIRVTIADNVVVEMDKNAVASIILPKKDEGGAPAVTVKK